MLRSHLTALLGVKNMWQSALVLTLVWSQSNYLPTHYHSSHPLALGKKWTEGAEFLGYVASVTMSLH